MEGVEEGRSPTVFRNHHDMMEITWMWSQTYWGCVTLNTLLDPLGLCFFYSGDNVTLSISSVECKDKMRLQARDRATGTRKPRKGFFFFSREVITFVAAALSSHQTNVFSSSEVSFQTLSFLTYKMKQGKG